MSIRAACIPGLVVFFFYHICGYTPSVEPGLELISWVCLCFIIIHLQLAPVYFVVLHLLHSSLQYQEVFTAAERISFFLVACWTSRVSHTFCIDRSSGATDYRTISQILDSSCAHISVNVGPS